MLVIVEIGVSYIATGFGTKSWTKAWIEADSRLELTKVGQTDPGNDTLRSSLFLPVLCPLYLTVVLLWNFMLTRWSCARDVGTTIYGLTIKFFTSILWSLKLTAQFLDDFGATLLKSRTRH